MVSDFVDERHGYLALTDEEYQNARRDDTTISKQARQLLAYGEGYWTCEKLMQQLEVAVKPTRRLMVGVVFGCSINQAAIQQWPKMLWMCQE